MSSGKSIDGLKQMIIFKNRNLRARCYHQKSHIWLASHRFPTPGLYTWEIISHRNMKRGLLVLWIYLLAAECGSHSLEFLSTGRVQPGSGPHFEQVTEFDGVVISHCDSGTQQEHFKPVLESHNLPGTCTAACYDVFDALKAISKFINHTRNLRVFANPVDRTKALLKCHVTSTDKSVRSVSLTEDGAPKANWITVTGPLPSGDGSVILILTAEVPLIHTNIYGCVVQTEDRTITVMWDGNTLDGRHILYIHMTFWRIIGIIFTVCCLISVMTLLFTREEEVAKKTFLMSPLKNNWGKMDFIHGGLEQRRHQ